MALTVGDPAASRKWLAWALLAVLYFISVPDSRYEADDAYDYASAVENAEFAEMVNPFHPLYLPLTRVIYKGTQAIAPDWRALDIMAALGAMSSAAAVVLFYLLLRRWLKASAAQAFFGAGGLGASYVFWRYAAEAEVYAFAALAGVVLLLAAATIRPAPWAVPAIALLAVFAFLAHSLNAAVAMIVPFVLVGRGWRMRRVVSTGLLGGLLLVVATYGLYLIARTSSYGLASETSYLGFYGGVGTQTSIGVGDAVSAIAVIGSTIVGANAFLSFSSVRDAIGNAFPNRALADEFFMGQTTPEWVGVASVATLMVVVVCAVVTVWKARRGFAAMRNTQTYLILAWLGAYVVVVALGGGVTQPEVWVLMLIPFWALVTNLVVSAGFRGMVLLVMPFVLALHSLVAGFVPLYVGENRQEILAGWITTNARPGDLVLTGDSSGLARYIAYQSEAHSAHIGVQGSEQDAINVIEGIAVMLEDEIPTSAIVSQLRQQGAVSGYKSDLSNDGRLFVTRDLFTPPDWLEVTRPRAAAALTAMGEGYSDLFVLVPGSDYILVRTTDFGH